MHYFLTICLIIFFGSESIFAKTKPSASNPQNILIVISFNKLRTERKEAVQPSKNYSLAGLGLLAL